MFREYKITNKSSFRFLLLHVLSHNMQKKSCFSQLILDLVVCFRYFF